MIFFRERWSEIAPVNVRRVGESYEIVKQTDFGFGVDARAGPGGLSSSDSPLHVKSSPHDLCHGWELPCWLPAVMGLQFISVQSLSHVRLFAIP